MSIVNKHRGGHRGIKHSNIVGGRGENKNLEWHIIIEKWKVEV